jgi:hypothetical protein
MRPCTTSNSCRCGRRARDHSILFQPPSSRAFSCAFTLLYSAGVSICMQSDIGSHFPGRYHSQLGAAACRPFFSKQDMHKHAGLAGPAHCRRLIHPSDDHASRTCRTRQTIAMLPCIVGGPPVAAVCGPPAQYQHRRPRTRAAHLP